ncbi:hypothetical protein ACXYMP_15335 [Aliiroseovarius sp. CAU 1755]
MGLKKLAAKVADYNDRLESGTASQIAPDHVKKVLSKLREKEAELQAELEKTEKPDKQGRLQRKLTIAREHISRAEWLLEQVS